MWKTFCVKWVWHGALLPAWNWIKNNYPKILFWIGVVAIVAGIVLTIAASAGATIPLWIQLAPSIIGAGLAIWQGIEMYS